MTESDILKSEVFGLLGQVALAYVISRLFVLAGQRKWLARACWLIPILYVVDRAVFFTSLDSDIRPGVAATATEILGILVPFLPALFLLPLLKHLRQPPLVAGASSEGST